MLYWHTCTHTPTYWTHLHTHILYIHDTILQLCFSNNSFVPISGRRLAQSFFHVILLRHPPLNTTAFFFSIVTAISAVWHEDCLHTVTVGQGWHTNTGNKSTVTKHNSSLSSFKLWKKKEKALYSLYFDKKKRSSLSLLMSSLLAADWLFCGVYRIFLLVQIRRTPS